MKYGYIKLANVYKCIIGQILFVLVMFYPQNLFAANPYLLVVYCDGGYDASMVFDNKLNESHVANESGATTGTGAGGISYVSHANRPSVDQYFNSYGASTLIVNGVYTGAMDRRSNLGELFGSVLPSKSRYMDAATYWSMSLAPTLTLPHVAIGAPAYFGDSPQYGAYVDKAMLANLGATIPYTGSLGSAGEIALDSYREWQGTELYDEPGSKSIDYSKLNDLYTSFQKEDVLTSTLGEIETAMGSQGSYSDLEWQGMMAIELFSRGKSQAVTLQAGKNNSWNTHFDNFANQTIQYEMLFNGLNTTLAHANARGILDNLIVVVFSNKGRNPKLNANNGKRQWPYTSVMIYGAGVKGGTTMTFTDSVMRGLPVNPYLGITTGSDDITIEMKHIFASLLLQNSILPNDLYGSILPFTAMVDSGGGE